MRIRGKFEEEVIGDDFIMVSMDTNVFTGFIRANKTGAFIFNCLKEGVSEEEIYVKLSQRYNVSESESKRHTKKIIQLLKQNNLLEE